MKKKQVDLAVNLSSSFIHSWIVAEDLRIDWYCYEPSVRIDFKSFIILLSLPKESLCLLLLLTCRSIVGCIRFVVHEAVIIESLYIILGSKNKERVDQIRPYPFLLLRITLPFQIMAPTENSCTVRYWCASSFSWMVWKQIGCLITSW